MNGNNPYNTNGSNQQNPYNGMSNTTVSGMSQSQPTNNQMYNYNTQATNSATQPVYNQNPTGNVGYQTSQQTNVNPMAAVANLNKDEAMEEALSHTNQYTPFEAPKQEVLEEPKKENNKSAYILIAVIVVIMALFILFLPQISKMFGW